jgi:CBS domain containing-hemolysin-like protein
MYAFIYVLNATANAVLRVAGLDSVSEGDSVHSREELRTVLEASHRHGELGVVEAKLLNRGLEFGDLIVGDLMRPVDQGLRNVRTRDRSTPRAGG